MPTPPDRRRGIDDPLKTVPSSRHPFQFFVMLALAFSGASVVTRDAAPGSINDLVDPVFVVVWGITMFVGGGMAVLSAFWPDRITGLLMERIALGAIGAVTWIYAIAVFHAFKGANGPLNSVVFVGLGAAAFWRVRQVQRELNRLVYFLTLRGGRSNEQQ